MLSRKEAHRLIERVLSYSKLPDCQVTIGEVDLAQTRFAENSITTSGRSTSAAITIASTVDRRTGTMLVNETSSEALRQAVAQSEALARFAPVDPEYVGPLGAQDYPAIAGYDEATGRAAQKEMLGTVKSAIGDAQARQLSASGYFERVASTLAVGNKRGNFGYAQRTRAEYSLTARTRDGTGSGWASGESHRLADIDGSRLARLAVDKAVLSQKARSFAPGKYTVVLEPAAVAGMMGGLFNFGAAFDARAAEEGRSLLSRRGGGTLVGEKLFADRITARCDPFDRRNPGTPWSDPIWLTPANATQGLFFGNVGETPRYPAAEKITWIENGVVKNLVHTPYWASKKNARPTPPANTSLVIDGEDHSLEDLIRSTERGLLVTRFWYIRFVNPKTVQLTGLTRDGLFWIEDGKIAHPVNNLRFNESSANVLANVEMLGRPELVERHLLPAMKVRDFTFSSVSDAV